MGNNASAVVVLEVGESVVLQASKTTFITYLLQWSLSKTTAHGTFKTWSLLPGGFPIQGHLTGNSITWSWFQWSSRTGSRLIRVVALTGFTTCICTMYSASVSE